MIKGVIFDLDGTLLNTLADLHNITNKTLEAFGYPPRSIEEVETYVGHGARPLIRRALPDGLVFSDEGLRRSMKSCTEIISNIRTSWQRFIPEWQRPLRN